MTHISTHNPATGNKLKDYKLHTDQQVTSIISKAHQCFHIWRRTSFGERSRLMHKAAKVLEANKKTYATTMTQEMGKTFTSACEEVEKCAWLCRYYADHAEEFLADEEVLTEASKKHD